MKNPVKNFLYDIKTSFGHVRGNARAVVAVHLFWALPFSLYSPYLTQYMLSLGCSKAEVGVINAVGMLSGGVIGVFAGWITDRLGRRRTNLISDMLSWALTCLLWGLASNFAWFIAASIANSFVRLISVSWNCTLVEDTPPDKRANVYWWLNVIGTLSACFTPLMAIFMGNGDPERLVAVMRSVLLVSAVLNAACFLVRHGMHRETAIGIARMEAARHESPLAALKAYPPMFRLLGRSPALLTFLLLRTLYFTQMNIKSTFLSVTAVQGLGFQYDIIGVINLVSGLVMLPAQMVLLRRLRSVSPMKALAASLITLLASNILLALSPAGNTALLMTSTVLSAIGSVVAGLMVDAETANAMPDADRAPLMGMMMVAIVLLSAVFQLLGGWLAELAGIGPRLPMGLVALLFAVCLVLLGLAAIKTKTAKTE